MILLWVVIFIISLVVLVKGADWLLTSSERIGLALGLSSFIVGVIIVGAGTSLPELISGIAAVIKGAPEIVVANAVGSNIANILLIIGVSAIFARKIIIKKDIVDIEIPLLAASLILFLGVAWDGNISFFEAFLLFASYNVYFFYSMFHRDADDEGEEKSKRPKLSWKDFALLIVGLTGLVVGSKYLIDSVIALSQILNIATGAIALFAVAIGTSLPELIVSVKAAKQGKAEIAVGNIFGSNAFNLLVVVGLPALFVRLPLDEKTILIGLPVLAGSTLLFILSGLSRKIYLWEGIMFLIIYILFIGKLFVLF